MLRPQPEDQLLAGQPLEARGLRLRDRQRNAVGQPGAQADAILLDMAADEIHRRRADEAGNEAGLGVVIEILRAGDLLDQAAVHDHDPVGERHRLDLIVGDIDGRGLDQLMDALDLGAHLHAQLGVEIRQRLVEQEDFWIAHDGAAHRHALALATRQSLRLAVQKFGDVENTRGIVDAFLDLDLGELAQFEPERHVLEHAHMRIERVVLEHHRDVAILGRQVVDDLAADKDVAGGQFFEARDHAQRRRLAAARRPDQHDEFVVGNVEIDAAHRLDIVETLDHVTQRDFGHFLKPLVGWDQPLVAPAVRPAM